MKLIDTPYSTIAAVDDTGAEYIAIPVFEDSEIVVYRLPSGGATDIKGVLYLPDDAKLLSTHDMDDCRDADAAYEKCERLLLGLKEGGGGK